MLAVFYSPSLCLQPSLPTAPWAPSPTVGQGSGSAEGQTPGKTQHDAASLPRQHPRCMRPAWRATERSRLGAVQEFLIEIQASQHVDYPRMAPTLVAQARAADEVSKLIALRWLREFVRLAKPQLLPHYASVLEAVLPGLSHPSAEVATVSLGVFGCCPVPAGLHQAPVAEVQLASMRVGSMHLWLDAGVAVAEQKVAAASLAVCKGCTQELFMCVCQISDGHQPLATHTSLSQHASSGDHTQSQGCFLMVPCIHLQCSAGVVCLRHPQPPKAWPMLQASPATPSRAAQVAREANKELLEVPQAFSTKETAAVLRVVSAQLGSPQEQTRLDALHWVHTLLRRDQRLVRLLLLQQSALAPCQ